MSRSGALYEARMPGVFLVTDYGPLGADPVVNLQTLNRVNALATAYPGGGAIIVPFGEWLLADTFNLGAKVALATWGLPVTIDVAPSLSETPIRCWLAPGPAFNPANPLVATAKHSAIQGVAIDAQSLADRAVEIGDADLKISAASLFGGLSWTLHDGGTGHRTNLFDSSVNNLANATGAILAAGNDWVVTGVRKKAGNAVLGSPGQIWGVCHLTGGKPNVTISAPGRIGGSYIDSTSDATQPLVLDSRSGSQQPAFVFAATKFYQGSAATRVPMIQRTGAAPSPLTVDGACSVEAVGGAAFTFLVDYQGGAGGVADIIEDGLQVSQNGLSGAAPALYNNFLPAYLGTIYYQGAAYPPTNGIVPLAADTALPAAAATNLFSTPTLQPGTYDVYAVVTVSITTTGGSGDLLLSATGTMAGLLAGSGRLTAGSSNQVLVFCTVVVTAAGVITASFFPSAPVVGATARVLPNSGSGSGLVASYMTWKRRGA